MDTTEMKGLWNEQKGKLKQKFAVLTDGLIQKNNDAPAHLRTLFLSCRFVHFSYPNVVL